MIRPISILVFLLHLCGFSQGDESLQIAVSIFTSTLPETQSLNHIRKDQDTLLMYHKNIAQKMSAILVLKEAELLSLEKTPAKIEKTTPYLDAFNYLDQIIAINANSISIINNFPEPVELPLNALLNMSDQTYSFLADFGTILSDGKQNLMKPTDRYILLDRINEKLAKLYSVSVFINELMRLQMLTADEPLEPLDISGPMNEIIQEIATIVEIP